MAGYTSALLAGIAERLAASTGWAWSPTGAYLNGSAVPIFIGQVPSTPDLVVVLTAYGIDDDPALTDSTTGVQVRTRGNRDPRSADDLADTAFDVLHGLHDVVLGGVPVALLARASWTALGADSTSRYERSDNYRAITTRPSTNRQD